MATTAELSREERVLLERFDDTLWMVRVEFDPWKDKRTTNLLRGLTRRGYLQSRIGVGFHPYREWALSDKALQALGSPPAR